MTVHMLKVLYFIEDKLKTKQSQGSQNQNYASHIDQWKHGKFI